MSKVVVTEFLSVDGVMQSPGYDGEDPRGGFQHGGWQPPYFDDAAGKAVIGGIQAASGLLLGRRTYEIFAGHWPNQPADDPLAPALNAMPKYVASTTLKDPLEWENSTLLGDVANDVAKLRQRPGGDLLVIGSGELVKTLLEHDLIDEYRLMIHPLILGSGRRLFPDGIMRVPLRLVQSETTTTGVLILTYRAEQGDARGEGGQ
jgi:dihydrofolate reductase